MPAFFASFRLKIRSNLTRHLNLGRALAVKQGEKYNCKHFVENKKKKLKRETFNRMNNYILHTKSWIKEFVIGYNLCPFAAKPFEEDRIKYVLLEENDIEKLLEQTILEAMDLKLSDSNDIETTIIIHPNVLTDFFDYIEVMDKLQNNLKIFELEGHIQLATFHPNYQFDGTQLTDAQNFTNRSPYPMIHLIKEDSVAKAISSYPDIHKIPARNMATMNRVGTLELKKKFQRIIEKKI